MTDSPGPSEEVHDTSLMDVERECWYDEPLKAQTEEQVIEGVGQS